MARKPRSLTFGFPRMHKEAGERRDFLPDLVELLGRRGCEVVVEEGIGSGMGLSDADYTATSERVRVGTNAEAYQQDVVMVLRSPELDQFERLRTGASLISMLHFPTRPRRIRRLLGLGVHAIGLDSIVDDEGRRLVENMRAVAWNGVEAAFEAFERLHPERFTSGAPIRATVMGVGQVGKHAVEAATKYGSFERARRLQARGPGVEVTVLGRALTGREAYMSELLRRTDVLIDATQRADSTQPLVPNAWLGELPPHAVLCDLVVDPYILTVDPPTVRSLEGIPQGSLDHYVFEPDDPKWDATVPAQVPSRHRRTAATCYSWPGVHPQECMEHYGRQLAPLLDALVDRGGVEHLRPEGEYHERALARASLASWAHNAARELEE